MLYINLKERKRLSVFRECLYRYLKDHELRYSDQRERVLKMLYAQKYPLAVDKLLRLLNENQSKAASYPTVVRHINFFNDLGWLKVVDKRHKEYLLIKTPPKYKEEHEKIDEYDPL
ncbi:MAG: transcriptional repressor [Campylobacterota bacterium]|nr:transcriptional repressor [Campylobacterota bacterium]